MPDVPEREAEGTDARAGRGRFRAGASGNLAGRRAGKPFLKLLEAAAACGARVVVEVPTRAVPRRRTVPDPPPRPRATGMAARGVAG